MAGVVEAVSVSSALSGVEVAVSSASASSGAIEVTLAVVEAASSIDALLFAIGFDSGVLAGGVGGVTLNSGVGVGVPPV